MNWTPTDAMRRWIVVLGLILGPVLLVVSVALNLGAPEDSIRANFDAMATRYDLVLLQAMLETIGFMIVLAAFAGATQALRHRGGALGTWGAVLSVVGIVGFAASNTSGLAVVELAQLPDHGAAFDTAGAMLGTDTASTLGTIGMVFEILGQVGILLVICGLIRARIVTLWILLLVIVGIVVNVAIGMMVTTLIADVLLLAACTWVAVRLARSSHETWLGMPASATATPATASVPV